MGWRRGTLDDSASGAAEVRVLGTCCMRAGGGAKRRLDERPPPADSPRSSSPSDRHGVRYRADRRRRSLTQVNGCPVPAGVWWVSWVCCSRSKPAENRSTRLSALYRAVGRPEHWVGPSSANVPTTKAPPGLIAWVTRST